MELTGICSLCGKTGKIHTCQLCGSLVCEECYNPSKGICRSCNKRNIPDIKTLK
ncbi:orotate phosphoribosyltransferase [Methanobacterium lacus]|uniref:Orotate phosphoribosyltransferase n=1 Tax=Methanobacterium lacus (strain AL-21) TaxID=877455 RepID=F0TAH7_METLA|nr:hypothetical protein [Methanobacterium lacus]ADZ08929.1 orotate phosphoribosyltransferase [Methanobacterium lacus]